MPAEKQIRILHAGLHKTGSTYLQHTIFPNLRGVTFIPRLDLGRAPVLAAGEQEPILFSSEASCGYPAPITEKFSPDRLLSNVRLLCIDKVVVVRRNFESWVLSLWFQTLNEGYSWGLEKFLDKNLDALQTWREAPEVLRRELEAESVGFLCIEYEELLKNREATLRILSNYIGGNLLSQDTESRANVSRWGKTTIVTYRFLNVAYKNIFVRAMFRALALTPRKMIQGNRSPLAKVTESMSASSWTSSDVSRLIP